MNEQSVASIFVDSLLINNFVFSVFLGMCPFLGLSGKFQTSWRMGVAVMFVITVSSMLSYAVNMLLVAMHAEYLRLISYIVIIACTVQLIEMFIKKTSPALFRALGVYLPLITTNCAVLGVALLNVEQKFSLFKSLLYGFGSALGFTIVLLIFAGLRERIALARVPAAFAGAPISFVTISLLALAFMGFSGLNV